MRKKSIICMAIIAAFVIIGCGAGKQPHDPYDQNVRYMYFTCWPDNCRLSINVVFKDGTPTFHDERTTKEHEPIVYSVKRSKVKKITVKVEKFGWNAKTMEWKSGEVPFDVFVKLEEKR